MKLTFFLLVFLNSLFIFGQENRASSSTSRGSPNLNVGFGFIYPFDKTQNRDGREESDPISPTITLNGSWGVFSSISFSPILGYSQYTNKTRDTYGGNYTVESFYAMYDFTVPFFGVSNLDFRYGLGAVQKTVKGGGGIVDIPNGNSTTLAFKPNVSKSTSTMTLNIGFDYKLNLHGTSIKNQGLRLELFYFQPFDQTKKMLSSSLGYNLFF